MVRQGERSEIVDDAELFLLIDPRSLVIFSLGPLVEVISWVKPDVMLVRLQDRVERGYRELAVTDAQDRFVRFQRLYGGGDSRLARVSLTSDRDLARTWQNAPDVRAGRRHVRHAIRPQDRLTMSASGSVYDRESSEEVMQFIRRLVRDWRTPDATIPRARRIAPGVWADRDAKIDPGTRFVGPAWIGAGRHVESGVAVVGPAALWDVPALRPQVEDLQWQEIEPSDVTTRPVTPREQNSFQKLTKRLFDIAAALFALACTLPFYPIIMLAIWLEDGRPFFFSHMRETVGGRQFPCHKFRSMRRDAEQIKARLSKENASDGPQFFMKNDPRLTKVGKLLRDLNVDEFPQFWNVLMGDMSIVGPRPSPHKENQFCPPWREARLSVRPGITGLWQIMRSRRQGLDFQEWIRYDIQYVENVSWRLDLWIIWKTIVLMIFKAERQ